LTFPILAWRNQLLFNGFAEFDVALSHAWCNVAVNEKGQNPFGTSRMQFGRVSLGTLRSGALASRVQQAPGGFGLCVENFDKAISIDVDQGVQEGVKVTHGASPALIGFAQIIFAGVGGLGLMSARLRDYPSERMGSAQP
jgi:hypothetical protein